ncbi:MAG: protein kinase [Desulfobacteraceae bacterium]|jgi:DNA-binding response OmpR family regulator/predicted Ser/Thr protein kinase
MNDKKNILFINRDENFLREITEPLSRNGYAVSTAMDMREALSSLSSTEVDLILCDNKLRDVSGYDFLRFLKNDPLRDKVPCIFCVPLHDQGSAKKAFKDGATDFIVYPMKPEEIVSRINEICYPSENNKKESSPQSDQDMNFSATQMVRSIPDKDKEKRKDKRIALLRILKVEISRNGILWIPGQVKNISSKGMFLKTSMLGKAGVELYVRVTLPSGTAVVKGSIKHIDFKNLKVSEGAGIGVEVEKSAEWQEFLKYIKDHLQKGKSPVVPPKPVAEPQPVKSPERTIIMTSGDDSTNEADNSQQNKGSSYEERFYNSLIGKQLSNYKVVSLIGSGAMGGVFKGWDIALERAVALKVISFELSAQEKFREMFIKEARFISQLDNPNIASIYHIGNENQILYFAMEYIEGSSMAELIKKEVKLNTIKGLDYFITICEALDFMSQKNIIHRDLKPANIMINNQEVVKLVDFGVAATVDVEEKIKEGIVGSPYYISPDSINGLPLDQRSDIYSLGASFYHAFTGFTPFDGDNAEEVLVKHLNQELIPLRKRNPKVSASLGKIIEKMMAKKPEDRYQDYNEIIKELRSLKAKANTFEKLKNATLIFRVKK